MVTPLISPASVSALMEAAEEAAEYFSDVFDEIFATNDDADKAAEVNAVLRKLERAIYLAKGSDRMAYVAQLPFVSRLRSDHSPTDEKPTFDVVIWQSATNICEQREFGFGRCDTGEGLYYGTSDSREPKFCPRHYYEMHFGERASYQLLDQTIEEYIGALDAKRASESK